MDRFYTVTHLIRTKQFEFTSNILPSEKVIICSACNGQGHNKRNKMCPMLPCHPKINFDDSEDKV